MIDWTVIEERLALADPFILTEDEMRRIATVEQEAYQRNLPSIRDMLTEHEQQLRARRFWTELQANEQGLRFRYSYRGFYGPGGFTSESHIAGPLVLGTINPMRSSPRGYWPNDLQQNTFLGDQFDEVAFERFIDDNLRRYLATENQILSLEQYSWIRSLQLRKS